MRFFKSEFKDFRLLQPLVPKLRNDRSPRCHREIWEKGIVAISGFHGMTMKSKARSSLLIFQNRFFKNKS